MSSILLIEQALNGLQFGLMLFLLASGLTLVFGIMDMINLAHGALYMVGAFLAAWLYPLIDSFALSVALAMVLTAGIGMIMEVTLLRPLYARDHLSQVLATFALILILNESVKMVWGTDLPLSAPAALSGPIEILPGLLYPSYRLMLIGMGSVLALALYLLVNHTKLGAWVRAGASDRQMAMSMGINIKRLFTAVFGLGAAMCAFSGAMLAPLLAVQVGMGENILILAFVVIVIGGIGSIWGAFVGSILVGVVDTLGRGLLPHVLGLFLPPLWASAAGPSFGLHLGLCLDGWGFVLQAPGAVQLEQLSPLNSEASPIENPNPCPPLARDASMPAVDLCHCRGCLSALGAHRLRFGLLHFPAEQNVDLGTGGLQLELHFRLWWPHLLWTCGLFRCWRLHHGHADGGRRHQRLGLSGCIDRGEWRLGAAHRAGESAHARGVLHHDHARLCPNDVLPDQLHQKFWWRRGH